MRVRSGAILVLALAAASPLAAQSVARPQAPRGWIGISFQIVTTGDQTGTRTEATITQIMDGSPAEKAGLRPGDHLVSVNGVGYQDNFGRLSRTLHPGDRVRIVVERAGRRREVRLRAVALPPNVVPPPTTVTWSTSSDSVADMMFRAMDSLRLRLGNVGPAGVRVVTIPDLRDSLAALSRRWMVPRILVSSAPGDSAAQSSIVTFFRTDTDPGVIIFPEVHPPFRLYAPRAAPDSLLEGMEEGESDAERALREARLSAVPVPDFGPLTPYRLGQNWVAGAQMVDLKPGLGAYFRVGSGVLVVDVPEGTPAALAGLQAGDVIVEVEGRPVRSIEDLRTGLSEPGDTLKLQVVRRGRTIRALLGR